jgi:hypothetical protein
MTLMAEVNIGWKEELVEGPASFYVKLSPKISYRIVGGQQATNAVAERALKDLQKAAKRSKG